MKKLLLILMLGLMTGVAGAQTFGSDTPPNPSPGRPEGQIPGGGAGAPVAEGILVVLAAAAGYGLLRKRKER